MSVGDRRVVLLLDNCEHVREAVAAACATLLSRCSQLAILATSRARLGVDGEHVLTVSPLGSKGSDAAAVQMLRDRIAGEGRARPEDLVEICRVLDGVPLAIELVAARCRTMSTSDVLERLPNRLRFLGDARRVNRQRSLEATMRWSFDLLNPWEQQLLGRMAVFSGTATLPAIEAICGGDENDRWDLDDALAALVDASMVSWNGETYGLLGLTREFAWAQMDATGEAERIRNLHLGYYLRLVRSLHDDARGIDEARAVARLRAEWANIRAAFRWACDSANPEAATDIVAVLGSWMALWWFTEAFHWSEEAYRTFIDHPGVDVARLAGAAGWAAWFLGDSSAARTRGLQASAAQSHVGATFDYLPEYALIAGLEWTGASAEALAVGDAVIADAKSRQDHFDTALWQCQSVVPLEQLGQFDEAVATSRDAVVEAATAGSPALRATAGYFHALSLADTDKQAALAFFRQAIEFAQRSQTDWVELEALSHLATTYAALGETTTALTLLVESGQRQSRSGFVIHAAVTVIQIAALLAQLGHCDSAALLVGRGLESGAAGLSRLASQLRQTQLILQRAIDPDHLEALLVRGGQLTLGDAFNITESHIPPAGPTA
jgi:predicted ATPase